MNFVRLEVLYEHTKWIIYSATCPDYRIRKGPCKPGELWNLIFQHVEHGAGIRWFIYFILLRLYCLVVLLFVIRVYSGHAEALNHSSRWEGRMVQLEFEVWSGSHASGSGSRVSVSCSLNHCCVWITRMVSPPAAGAVVKAAERGLWRDRRQPVSHQELPMLPKHHVQFIIPVPESPEICL